MKRSDFLKRLGRLGAAIGIGVVLPDDTLSAEKQKPIEQGKKVQPVKDNYTTNVSGMCSFNCSG